MHSRKESQSENEEAHLLMPVQDNTSLSHLTLTSSKNPAQSFKKIQYIYIIQPYDMTFNDSKTLENRYTHTTV